jgi:hypothetical protein
MVQSTSLACSPRPCRPCSRSPLHRLGLPMLLLALGVVWTLQVLCAKVLGDDHVPPIATLLVVHLLALPVFIALLRRQGRLLPRTGVKAGILALAALLGNVSSLAAELESAPHVPGRLHSLRRLRGGRPRGAGVAHAVRRSGRRADAARGSSLCTGRCPGPSGGRPRRPPFDLKPALARDQFFLKTMVIGCPSSSSAIVIVEPSMVPVFTSSLSLPTSLPVIVIFWPSTL